MREKKIMETIYAVLDQCNRMFVPRIAMTMSSFKISMDPRDMKYIASRTSPRCTRVSPGGTCVVLNFIDNALKHPGLAPTNIRKQW